MQLADHYRTLGVASTADETVIRAVYVALMKRFHPDRSSTVEDLKRAQAINEAYAVLSDPKRRAAYDRERAGMQPWERGAALPQRRRGFSGGGLVLAAFGAAALAGAYFYWPMLPEREVRGRTAMPIASTPAHCAQLADPERIRTALIMRLDEVGALGRAAAGALTVARFDLAAATDARDLAAPGRVACLATLAITLPADFSTASGQGTILSELQFSASRTGPDSGMSVHPDGRLVAALSGIRHQPTLPVVANPMLDDEVAVVAEPQLPAPSFAPERRVPTAVPVRKTRAERQPTPVVARGAHAPPPASGSGLGGVDRQTMNFYGQSLRSADGARKSKLEASQLGFAQRLAACGSDTCRRDAYLERNVEISRIMMGE